MTADEFEEQYGLKTQLSGGGPGVESWHAISHANGQSVMVHRLTTSSLARVRKYVEQLETPARSSILAVFSVGDVPVVVTQPLESLAEFSGWWAERPAAKSNNADLGQSLTQVFSSPVADVPAREPPVAPVAPVASTLRRDPGPPPPRAEPPAVIARPPISPSVVFESLSAPPPVLESTPPPPPPSVVFAKIPTPARDARPASSNGARPASEPAPQAPEFRDAFRPSNPPAARPEGLGIVAPPPSLRDKPRGPSPYTQVITPAASGMPVRVDTVAPPAPTRPPSVIPVVIAVGVLIAALLVVGVLLLLGSKGR